MTVSLNKTSKVELLPLERSVHISEKVRVQKYVANDKKNIYCIPRFTLHLLSFA